MDFVVVGSDPNLAPTNWEFTTEAISVDIGDNPNLGPTDWQFQIEDVPPPGAPGFVMRPNTALFRGGREVILQGSMFDMATVQDPFTGGPAPFWDDLSIGGTVTTPVGTPAALAFDTGASAGGTAVLRDTVDVRDVDAAVTWRVTADVRPRILGTGAYTQLALRLIEDASNRVGLLLHLDIQGLSAVFEQVRGGQISTAGIPLFAPRPSFTDLQVNMRLLRAAHQLILFVNGQVVFRVQASRLPARLELQVANDTTVSSRLSAHASGYLRRPVVRFRDVPMLDVAPMGREVIRGTTPPVPAAFRTEDVVVTALDPVGSARLGAFTFTREPDLLRWRTQDGAEAQLTSSAVLSVPRGTRN